VIALLPFGAGQFQNGDKALGAGFAAAEVLTLATSVVCFFWVTNQANPDGNYSASTYPTALNVREVQIGTGIGFGALWLLGSAEAFWHMRQPTVTREEAAPSTAPSVVGASFEPLPGGGMGSLKLSFF
jgi:hypothetical protein